MLSIEKHRRTITTEPTTIENLPTEIIKHILSPFIEGRILELRLVCKNWKAIIDHYCLCRKDCKTLDLMKCYVHDKVFCRCHFVMGKVYGYNDYIERDLVCPVDDYHCHVCKEYFYDDPICGCAGINCHDFLPKCADCICELHVD